MLGEYSFFLSPKFLQLIQIEISGESYDLGSARGYWFVFRVSSHCFISCILLSGLPRSLSDCDHVVSRGTIQVAEQPPFHWVS